MAFERRAYLVHLGDRAALREETYVALNLGGFRELGNI